MQRTRRSHKTTDVISFATHSYNSIKEVRLHHLIDDIPAAHERWTYSKLPNRRSRFVELSLRNSWPKSGFSFLANIFFFINSICCGLMSCYYSLQKISKSFKSIKETLYDLTGVVCHSGSSYFGHYVSMGRLQSLDGKMTEIGILFSFQFFNFQSFFL